MASAPSLVTHSNTIQCFAHTVEEISRLDLPKGNAVIPNGSDGSIGTHGRGASRTVEVDDVFTYVNRLDTKESQSQRSLYPFLA